MGAAKDNFSFSAGIPGLGNVGFSTADKPTCSKYDTDDLIYHCTSNVTCCAGYELMWVSAGAAECYPISWAGSRYVCAKNKDNFSFSAGIPGLGNVGFSTADQMMGANRNTWSPTSRLAKDNFSFSAGTPGLGNVGFSTADSETCTTEVGRDARCLNNNGCCGTNKCHKSFCALPHVPRSTNNMLTDNLHETPGRCDANN